MDGGPPVPCRQSVWHSRQYWAVQVRVDDRLVPRLAHRLILAAFAGPPPEGKPQCRHLNGRSTDNRASNLAWGSAGENGQDRVRHRRVPWGEKHVAAKLSARAVRAIRRRRQTAKWYADKYGVSRSCIYQIFQGRSWRHLDEAAVGT
ncbi:MAG: HNH endonuclease [Gemmataceae bacterium]